MAGRIYANLHPGRIANSLLSLAICGLRADIDVLALNSLQGILGSASSDLQRIPLIAQAKGYIPRFSNAGVAKHTTGAALGSLLMDADNVHTFAVKRRDIQAQANRGAVLNLRVHALTLDLVQGVIDLIVGCRLYRLCVWLDGPVEVNQLIVLSSGHGARLDQLRPHAQLRRTPRRELIE